MCFCPCHVRQCAFKSSKKHYAINISRLSELETLWLTIFKMAGKAKDLIADDVQKLITLLSGFSEKEDSENFELCEKFAYSNLLHHRYLSVDSHAVRRSVFGMVTKFMIHGHLEASRRLDCLLNKFMDCNVFGDKEAQWAILSLLVKLADNPTSHISETFSVPKMEEIEDKSKPFDWTTYSHLCDYLKEGNEEFDTNFQASSDSEEWEDLSDNDQSPKKEGSVGLESEEILEIQKKDDADTEKDTERQLMIEQLGRRVNAEDWLSNNIQKPWWNTNQLTEKVDSVFPSANLARTWDQLCDESTATISEYKVVREILWMLQAPTTTTLFQEIDGQFCVQSNISIPSLTKDSMTCYLNPLCDYFNMIHQLQKFQKEIYPMDLKNPTDANPKIPSHTFESYTSAIIEFLRELQKLACDIEKKVKDQEDIYTLYSLNLELAPKLSQLRAVYSVHISATKDWKITENWLSSARLLSVLYSEALACMECDTPCILLRIFLKSFRPYVDIIDVWLTEGRLDDYRNEFVIAKKSEIDCEDWGSDFVMRDYVSELKAVGIRALPLLQVIVDRVLHAGCSMKLLQQLDRLSDMRSQHSDHGRMYADFLESLEKEISQMVKNKSESTALEVAPITGELDIRRRNLIPDRFISDVSCQLESMKDNYMMQAFKDYIPFKVQSFKRDAETLGTTGAVFRRLATYSTCGLLPIKPVMERIISQLIDAKHAAACLLVKTIFLQEFNLSTHLALIRAIYLMEAGDIMHRFCVFIFRDADHSILWANSYVLTAQLEECINLRYPDHSSKFSVIVNEDGQLNGTPSVMDEISVKYTVDWPLTLILSPTNMEYYNSVFQFLLKVKWALWALEELRFADLVEDCSNHSITKDDGLHCRARCLQVLRFWLLHSVGSVHTYLMGQVLHSLGLQLERDLAAATDLDSLLRAHDNYVVLVHTHCLQPQSNDVIKTAILQMVQLSLELRDLWCLGLAQVSDAKLITMTEMYIKCHCFLGSVLQTSVESGRLTHCVSSLTLPSCAEKESNLFSDHMKYSLTFLAWQREPPCGITFPLPKCLHKYLEKGVWNEKRSDAYLTAQKLEIFLDNYFLFLSKRKKLINSKGRLLSNTEVTLEITDLIGSNSSSSNYLVNEVCSPAATSKSEHKSSIIHSSVTTLESSSDRIIIVPEKKTLSSHSIKSKISPIFLIKDDYTIQESRKCIDIQKDNFLQKESCHEKNIQANSFPKMGSGCQKENSNFELCSRDNKKCLSKESFHFIPDSDELRENCEVDDIYHSSYQGSSSSDDNSIFCSKNFHQNRNCKSNKNHKTTSEVKKNERCLLLNEKTLKSIRQKCVRPNIKHSSKSGRKFYECVGSTISNVGKALKSKRKSFPCSSSIYTQYNLSITQEKKSGIDQCHQEFPVCSHKTPEVYRNDNSLVQGNSSGYFPRQLNERVTSINENTASVVSDSNNNYGNEVNIKSSVTSYPRSDSSRWNEKLEELALRLLRRSLHENVNKQDKEKMLSTCKMPKTLNKCFNDTNKELFPAVHNSVIKENLAEQESSKMNKNKKNNIESCLSESTKRESQSKKQKGKRECDTPTLPHSLSFGSCNGKFHDD